MHKPMVKKWSKAFWITGMVGVIAWLVLSTFLIGEVEPSSSVITVFDPAYLIAEGPLNDKYAHEYPYEEPDWIKRQVIMDFTEKYALLRVLSYWIIIGLVGAGFYVKNRACASVFLLLPYLNYYLAFKFGNFGDLWGWEQYAWYILFILDLGITILLLFGVIGVFSYHKAPKAKPLQPAIKET